MSLFERTVSGFPLSISTALAFESLFPPREEVYDPERKIPEKVDISKYTQMWVNVDTLFRNLTQSVTGTVLADAGYKEAASVLIDEMDTIASLLAVEGQGIATPIFYACDYPHALANTPKMITLRKPDTGKQLHYSDLRNKTMKELKKLRSDIKFFQGGLRSTGPTSSLILTHVPFDLLSYKQFSILELLESNTGKLKRQQQWNSKYYPIPKRDMSILPWMRSLLFILGDKVNFVPSPMSLRAQIMDCAQKREWTPLTTKDKVLLDLRLDLHPFDYAVFSKVTNGT